MLTVESGQSQYSLLSQDKADAHVESGQSQYSLQNRGKTEKIAERATFVRCTHTSGLKTQQSSWLQGVHCSNFCKCAPVIHVPKRTCQRKQRALLQSRSLVKSLLYYRSIKSRSDPVSALVVFLTIPSIAFLNIFSLSSITAPWLPRSGRVQPTQ